MTLRLFGKNARLFLTEQGTSSEQIGLNLSGQDGALVAKRGSQEALFSVEPDAPGLPAPFDTLKKYADRTKESGLVLMKYRENQPLTEAIAGEAFDKVMAGSYVNSYSENCPADTALQAILYQKSHPATVTADESFIATAVMQKMFVALAKVYKHEMDMGLSIDNPSSLAQPQYTAGGVFPSPEHIAWVATQPWFDSRKIDSTIANAELAEVDALESEMEVRCPLNVPTEVNFTAALGYPQVDGADDVRNVNITWHLLYKAIFLIHMVASLQLSGLDPATVLTAAGPSFQDELNEHMTILTGGSAGDVIAENTQAIIAAANAL